MLLVILGISESSKVAIGIFIFHLTSLVILCGSSFYYLFTNGFEVLILNFKNPIEGNITTALFFGFAAAMLGISGFESSANYVEEQKTGVFPKTLRNMWILVTVFNPLLAFLALTIIPISEIDLHEETLLSFMGNEAAGNWLFYLISIDAVLVLSGAVLTSFVGVGGLVERMALDRILPHFLLKKNKRNSSYMIFLTFFILCCSILFITRGDLEALAGVYTIAFLIVMILFGIGNLLLKINRAKLPRPERVGWFALFLAIAGVLTALIGNVLLNPPFLLIFLEYLIPTILVVGFMLYRIPLFKGVLRFLDYLTPDKRKGFKKINGLIKKEIRRIQSQKFVFFTNHDDVSILNKVLLYITKNENTRNLKIVAVIDEGEKLAPNLEKDIEVLDRVYPEIVIEFVKEKGQFRPEKIKELSKRWNIPINFMFVGSPSKDSHHSLEEMGDVRLII